MTASVPGGPEVAKSAWMITSKAGTVRLVWCEPPTAEQIEFVERSGETAVPLVLGSRFDECRAALVELLAAKDALMDAERALDRQRGTDDTTLVGRAKCRALDADRDKASAGYAAAEQAARAIVEAK